MKKLLLPIVFLISTIGFSQVKDISFTLSPSFDYTFFDKQSGLENATSVGGKLGFGFGEYVEIRATYLQSLGLKTNFSNYGIPGYTSATFQSQDINLIRWGGELKANLSKGILAPYITIGSGVQNIEIKNANNFDQIYTTVGLGIKTKLTDRLVFNLEGKYNRFNFNSGKNLLTTQNKIDFSVTDADFESNALNNWSAQASLQLYLGGRRPGTLSELDKAYYQKFRNGFKGIQWIVEPSINYISFDNESLYKDTYLLGAYAGIDFNQYTGLRAFYLRSTENEQISTNFDGLSMYGLEFRARLNDGNGVTPYLILGGGYMEVQNSYIGKTGLPQNSQEFAQAGLGLNIPLSKNVLITGGARGLVTSSTDVEALAGPDQLRTHIMYNAGIKLAFGGKKTDPNSVYNSQLNRALEAKDAESQAFLDQRLAEKNADNDAKLAELKSEYQEKIALLELELVDAKAANDVDKAVTILEQKKTAEKALEDVKELEKKSTENADLQQIKIISNKIETPATEKVEIKVDTVKVAPKVVTETQKVETVVVTPKQTEDTQKVVDKDSVPVIKKPITKSVETKNVAPVELIKLTPAELDSLIDKVMDANKTNYNNAVENEKLRKRIEVLEKALLEKPKVKTTVIKK